MGKKFEALVRFKETYGHCFVPLRRPDPTGLGRWVNNQRQFAKKGQLKDERVKRLKKIGFSFDAFEDQWQKMFAALVAFKKLQGHCNVPANWSKNPKLARWVHTNRNEMKAGKLNQKRFEQLHKLGFAWQRHDVAWEEMYTKLIRFKNKFGHCRVTKNWEDAKLAMWVSAQRRFLRKESLSQDRIKKLNQIGFQWNGRGNKKDSKK